MDAPSRSEAGEPAEEPSDRGDEAPGVPDPGVPAPSAAPSSPGGFIASAAAEAKEKISTLGRRAADSTVNRIPEAHRKRLKAVANTLVAVALLAPDVIAVAGVQPRLQDGAPPDAAAKKLAGSVLGVAAKAAKAAGGGDGRAEMVAGALGAVAGVVGATAGQGGTGQGQGGPDMAKLGTLVAGTLTRAVAGGGAPSLGGLASAATGMLSGNPGTMDTKQSGGSGLDLSALTGLAAGAVPQGAGGVGQALNLGGLASTATGPFSGSSSSSQPKPLGLDLNSLAGLAGGSLPRTSPDGVPSSAAGVTSLAGGLLSGASGPLSPKLPGGSVDLAGLAGLAAGSLPRSPEGGSQASVGGLASMATGLLSKAADGTGIVTSGGTLDLSKLGGLASGSLPRGTPDPSDPALLSQGTAVAALNNLFGGGSSKTQESGGKSAPAAGSPFAGAQGASPLDLSSLASLGRAATSKVPLADNLLGNVATAVAPGQIQVSDGSGVKEADPAMENLAAPHMLASAAIAISPNAATVVDLPSQPLDSDSETLRKSTSSSHPSENQLEIPLVELPDMPKREFSRAIRLLVLVLVTAAGFLGPIAMTAYYPGLEQISSDLQTSQEVLDLTVTVFTLSLAVFPLLWGVLSDWLGRKPMYLASLGSFAVGSLLCGLSVNIGMLVAFRVMQGAGSAAMLSIGAGTITDVFPQSQRGAAMALLSIGPLVGPSIAGPLGGVMTQFAGWRSVFYLSAGLGFAILAAITAFLPETGVRGRGSAPNPLKPLIYLKYPFVAVATLNVVVGYGISFAVLPDIPYLFTSTYDDVRDGLVLLAMTGGQLVGSLVSGFLSDRILRMVAKRGRGAIEDALWPALPSIVLLPGMLSVFGWSFTQKWHPSIPIISLIIMGSAMTAIATPCNTYIIDVIYWSPAAAVAIGSSFRYVIGAASPLATPPLIRSIGIGWTYTAFALAAFVAGAGLPWVVLRGADSRMKHRQWKKAPGGAKGESKKDVK